MNYQINKTGAQIEQALDDATKVVANPTLVGSESSLSGLEVNGVKYKVGGSSDTPSFDKKILSEDTITLSGYSGLIVPNFCSFMEETFGGENFNEWWKHMSGESINPIPITLPKDYRFTLVYADGSSSTFSFADSKDIGQYPTDSVEFGMNIEWDYGYSNRAEITATSEDSAEIEFPLANSSSLSFGVFIEADPETGDSRVVFGEVHYEEGESSIPVTDLAKLIVWMPSCNTHYVEKHIVNDFDGLTNCIQYIADNFIFDDEVSYLGEPIDKTFTFDTLPIEDLLDFLSQQAFDDTEIVKGLYNCGNMFLNFNGYEYLYEREGYNRYIVPLLGVTIALEHDPETGDSYVIPGYSILNEDLYPPVTCERIKTICNGTIRIKIEPTN